jgi:hypothetical protein
MTRQHEPGDPGDRLNVFIPQEGAPKSGPFCFLGRFA